MIIGCTNLIAMNNIGEKIRIQRQIKNYSQQYMAFMLEISQAAYSNIERGTTVLTIPRVFEIAEVLEISPFILMPRPKFGTGINIHAFLHTLYKLKQVISRKTKNRKRLAEKMDIVHSDISNSLDL